nr:hypothetical protein [Candidatus Sigynarchaeota archaeon]
MSLETSNMELKKERAKPERFLFVDCWRGFIIVYMLVSITLPEDWFKVSPILEFLLIHPARESFTMHLIDIGATSFVFILGLMYSVTFQRRRQEVGTWKAIKHIIIRYGAILLLGFCILVVTFDSLVYTTTDKLLGGPITVLAWDVIPALGLVGFVGLPFLFLKKKIRLISAYIMLAFYCVMLDLNQYTRWASDAVSAVHGGIFFGIFAFGATQVLASAIGEYLVDGLTKDRGKFLAQLGVYAGISLLVGIVLLQAHETFIPGYIIVATSTTVLGWYLFMYFENYTKIRMRFLQAYGRNPFFVYLITVIPMVIIYEVVFTGSHAVFEWDLFLAIIVFWAANIAIVWLLYVKNKRVRTEIVAIIGIAVLLGIGLPLRLLGVL